MRLETFMPIAKAGKDQNGYDLPTMANLKSQIITNNAIAARNAKMATGENIAAAGGGNMALPAGYKGDVFGKVNTSVAENQAQQLGELEYKNKELGRQNFFAAESALAGAPSILNSTIATSGGATDSAIRR